MSGSSADPILEAGRRTGEASSTSDYRAGVIGAGFMGRVHAHAIRAGGGELVGISASSGDRAALARAELGAARAYADARELIGDPDVNVVHICTPNHLHAPLARAAVDAGKHVVCEKPLAVDGTQAAALADSAARAGVVATVPFVYRFHPMAREAKAQVAAGAAGKIALAHGSYLQDWLLRPDDDNWRVDAELGGRTRAFGDIGSHWCDLLEFVTGDRITGLSAQLSITNPRRGGSDVSTEDVVTLQFATAGGVVGATVISQVSAGRKNRLLLEVSGSKATLSFDQEQPEQLWLGGRDRSSTLVRDPQALSPPAARLSRVPAGHAQGYQDCFNAFVADTAAAVAGEAPEGLPGFADGARAAQLAEAVLTSARERRWVEVSTP